MPCDVKATSGLKVAVSIVTYDNGEDIENCLEALSDSTYENFAVVICENGGAEAFARLSARVAPRLRSGQPVALINAGDNLGFAGGVNRTLVDETAQAADLIWILNPDALPTPHALERLLGRFATGDCDAVGGRVTLVGERVQSYGGRWNLWLARATSIGFGASSNDFVSAELVEARQNYLNGASMLVSQRFLARVGLMREDYFLYCEEVEWFLRARMRGMRLGFADRADVLHMHGTTTGGGRGLSSASDVSIFLGERNRILLTRDVAPLRLPVVVATSIVMFLLRCLRQNDFTRLRSGMSGWLAGVRNRRGRPTL